MAQERPAKKIVSFSLDKETYESFAKVCEDAGLKCSPVVNELLVWFLSKREQIVE